MKKSILIAAILSLFVLVGNNVSAQTNKAVATTKVEKVTIAAIKTIKDNKSLSDTDKQKFIKRLTALSNSAKATDKKTSVDFELEYNRIASNYKRITSKTLPDLNTTKSGN